MLVRHFSFCVVVPYFHHLILVFMWCRGWPQEMGQQVPLSKVLIFCFFAFNFSFLYSCKLFVP